MRKRLKIIIPSIFLILLLTCGGFYYFNCILPEKVVNQYINTMYDLNYKDDIDQRLINLKELVSDDFKHFLDDSQGLNLYKDQLITYKLTSRLENKRIESNSFNFNRIKTVRAKFDILMSCEDEKDSVKKGTMDLEFILKKDSKQGYTIDHIKANNSKDEFEIPDQNGSHTHECDEDHIHSEGCGG